jgi:hypothetical protein
MAPTQTQPPGAPSTWAVVILRGKEVEGLGTVEAPDQREAREPIEKTIRGFMAAERSSLLGVLP